VLRRERERERELGIGRMELSEGHTADVIVVNFMCHGIPANSTCWLNVK